MPNKTSGKQWLDRSYQDLTAAELLYEHSHSADTIAILAQQALEKMLKAILAYHNRKMLKSHDLLEILVALDGRLEISDHEKDLLIKASIYYTENRYPGVFYTYPDEEEIKSILDFSRDLYKKICYLLEV